MALEDDSTKEDRKALEEFLADSGCLDRLSKWTRGFNAFDVLGIARAEIRTATSSPGSWTPPRTMG